MSGNNRDFLSKTDKTKNKTEKGSKSSNKATITEVREKKKGFINPVLVSFQNGELIENHASDFSVKFTSNESGKTSIEVEAPYGHVFKDSNCNESSGKQVQVIAIRNRKTNKVRLIEVDSAVLINSALISTPKENVLDTPDYGKEVRALNRAFGGKKIKSRLEQRENFSINSSLVADEVKELVADIPEDTSMQTLNETESIIDLLPPCHRDTKILTEVYILNEILDENELKALNDEVSNEIIDMKSWPSSKYSLFFIFCYEKAKQTQDNLLNRLSAILFAEILIQFLKIPSKRLASKKTMFCSFSSVIHSKILNEFCNKTETSVTRPVSMRDKCLCYIITLSLLACNYEINLKLLATVTSVHLNKLSKLARIVGAVPTSKDETCFALKLPLPPLPKPSKKKVQRR